MKYTKLGNSDLTVSRICMGCMGFGDASLGQHSWTIDEEHSREIIKRGLQLGVNFFDTAIAYQSGTSEQYLGRALKDFARREDVVVATKFLPRTPEEIREGISGQQHIQRMIDKSLENLGMDYVDLYIYHMWDYATPLEDILDGLNRVVKEGKARYIGISNCFAWQLAKANALAEREGFSKFVSVQGHYNLIFREEEREMAPYCREENIAMTPYSALAGGRLSKRPGETSKRLQEDSYAQLKYGQHRGAGSAGDRPGGPAGRPAPGFHDGGFPGLAAGEGDGSGGGRHKAAPCGGRRQGGGPGAVPGGKGVSGGTVCTPPAGGRDGAEYGSVGRETSCMLHRRSENLKPIIRRKRGFFMRIGILCAGDTELEPFLACMEDCTITEKTMLKFYEGTLQGVAAVRCTAGCAK